MTIGAISGVSLAVRQEDPAGRMQKVARESREWTRIPEENLHSSTSQRVTFIRAYSRGFAGN
jgi:hypothetical protein